MSIYDLEAAFGAADKTSRAMRRAIDQWFSLYYGNPEDSQADPCQRIAYTVVNKLIRNVFAEYKVSARTQADCLVLEGLEPVARQAMQLALVGGECYLKPCPEEAGFSFALIPRCNALIFGRSADGTPSDVGLCACSTHGRYYYTLLERRYRQDGELVIENRLFRSKTGDRLGEPVPLNAHPDYAHLPEQSRLSLPWGVGLVTVRTPMLNCVDGSCEGVSVYAAAAGLIEHIDRNEAQLAGEFRRGQSRVFASADLLGQSGTLESDLFVGLDEDPQQVGITVFAPELRVDAYLARKQEYLRNVESIVGLKRGMLSDANMDIRTATEISASNSDFSITVVELQQMWTQAVRQTLALCGLLRGDTAVPAQLQVDWGNGILYDEEKTWESYRTMVSDGLLKPELALGWRFHLPADTPQEQDYIRKALMPEEK